VNPAERKRAWAQGLVGLALLVALDGVFIFLIAGSIRNGLRAHASRSWPTVPGVVTSARLTTSKGGRGATTCLPDIRYVYAVDGTSYTGRRVAFRDGYGCTEAERLVDRYGSPAVVTVHVRPGEPGTAVLEPGSWDGPSYLGFHVPLTLLLLFCTLLFAWGLRAVLREPRGGRRSR
jgi:hypothetical protein